jgi:hypothetical protein
MSQEDASVHRVFTVKNKGNLEQLPYIRLNDQALPYLRGSFSFCVSDSDRIPIGSGFNWVFG